jgi:uncharacterized protein
MVIPILGALFFLAFLGLFWGYWESKQRRINHHTVRLHKALPRKIQILHLSDIHFSGEDASLSNFFDRLAGETYDLVVITGDIFDCVGGIPASIENLKKLKSRFGIYAVWGNHDYYDYKFIDVLTFGFRGHRRAAPQPVKRFAAALEEAGVRLLINEKFELQIEKQKIVLYGLDDPTTGRADIEKAMHGYDPNPVNLLLTHTIDAFFYIRKNEVDLSFSGHSHGGQIRFPLIGPLITHTQMGPRYVDGIKKVKGAYCSISRGVNASRYFFLRLLAPPEAIVLEVEGNAV